MTANHPIGDNLSSNLSQESADGPAGPVEPGRDAAPVILGQDTLNGDATSSPGADTGDLLRYLNSAKLITSGFLPQSAPFGTIDSSSAFTAPPPALASIPDYGAVSGGAGQWDTGGVNLFAKGSSPGNGKPGGGGGGGNPPPQYTKSNAAGMTFVINWDSSVANAPSGFVSGVEAAAQFFLDNYASPITVTLDAGYGEVLGQKLPFGALGESSFGVNSFDYAHVYDAMQSAAAVQPGSPEAQAFGSLPTSDPLNASHYLINSSDQKALGLKANDGSLDGAVGFATQSRLIPWNFASTTTSSQYDFVSVAKHEISEVMGRVAWVGQSVADSGITYQNSYSNLDLFRYSFDDVTNTISRSTSTGGTANAYLSYDGGVTNQSYFNTNPNNGDVGDWSGATQSKDAYNYANGLGPLTVSSADTSVLNVLGYKLA